MGGDGARVGVRTQAPCQTEGWGEAAGEKWPVKDRKPEPRFQGVRARVAKLHCAQTVHTGPVRSHGLVLLVVRGGESRGERAPGWMETGAEVTGE